MKTIILDLAGTIVPNVEVKEFFEEHFGKDFVVPTDAIGDMLIGKMSIEEFWKSVEQSQHTHVADETKKQFDALPEEQMLLTEERKNFLKSISKKYNLILLSNTIPNIRDFMQKHCFTEFFDDVILSHEVGVKKPSPEIYALATQKAKYKEIIFFDDLEKNCIEARKLGIKAVWVRDYKDLESVFKQEGLY